MSIFSGLKGLFGGNKNVSEMPQLIPTNLTEAQQFSEPHIQLIERNHQVDSKEDMIHYIEDSGLSIKCREAFKNIASNVYDRNIIMADNSQTNGVDIAFLENKIDMFPIILTSATKTDRSKSEFLQIQSMLLMQLRTRLTRTTGPDRERIVSTRHTISTESIIKRGEEVKR